MFDTGVARGVGPTFHRYEELNIRSHISMLLRYPGSDVVKLENRNVRGPADIVSRFSNPEAVRAFLSNDGLMHWAYKGHFLRSLTLR